MIRPVWNIRIRLGILILLCTLTGLIISSRYLRSDSHAGRKPTSNEDRRQALGESDLLRAIEERKMCVRHDEDTHRRCIDPNCTQSLMSRISPENIESIRKPVQEVGMEKLREVIQLFNVTSEKRKYVFITGASANHFMESEAAIQSLQRNVFPHLTNFSFIYYDLGLTNVQRKKLTEKFREFPAQLKLFPFDKLPPRAAYLSCFIWKALIILAHLQKSEFVLWMDSSINYFGDIRPYFDKVKETGILINRNGMHFPQHVYLGMFEYFGDQPCQFAEYEEVEGGFLVLHNEPFTRHLVIEPWSACALDPNCMCPDQTKSMISCPIHVRKYGKCHRFDQAAIGYILIKILRENRESMVINKTWRVHEVKRGQRLQ